MNNSNPNPHEPEDTPLGIANKAVKAAEKKRIESKKRKDAIDILEDRYANITLAIESLNRASTNKGDKPVKREGGESAPSFWKDLIDGLFGRQKGK